MILNDFFSQIRRVILKSIAPLGFALKSLRLTFNMYELGGDVAKHKYSDRMLTTRKT